MAYNLFGNLYGVPQGVWLGPLLFLLYVTITSMTLN